MIPDTLTDTVESWCKEHLQLPCSMLLCVSGGSDSVALLYCMAALRQRLPFTHLGVAHVNHGLRGDASDGDEAFVEKLTHELNIEFFRIRLHGYPGKRGGIEAWARERRYVFFHTVKQSYGFSYIATAHTADDQAETVLMRLARGAGTRGLRGILPVREDTVIRPLLHTRKETLTTWLSSKNLSWRFDTSNHDTRFLRNSIRHNLLPALTRRCPDIIDWIGKFAADQHSQWEKIEQQVNKWCDRYVVSQKHNVCMIAAQGFDETTIANHGLVLLLGAKDCPVTRHHIDNIIENRKRYEKTFLLPGGWRYRPEKHHIVFFLEYEPQRPASFSCRLTIPGTTESDITLFTIHRMRSLRLPPHSKDNLTVYLDARSCGDFLTYRSVQADDVFQPLGTDRVVKVLRFLKSRKMPVRQRRNARVVCSPDNTIVWIPGIEIAENAKISLPGSEIVKISCTEKM